MGKFTSNSLREVREVKQNLFNPPRNRILPEPLTRVILIKCGAANFILITKAKARVRSLFYT